MAGDIELFNTEAQRLPSVEELKPYETTTAFFTRERARELTDMVRSVVSRMDELVATMYMGKIHLSLGYASWAEYCEAENIRLEFRPSRQQRRELHYALYHTREMPSRAVSAYSGFDQKTVRQDAHEYHRDLLAAGQESPERSAVITDTFGRRRPVGTGQPEGEDAEEVTVDAEVSDLNAEEPAGDEDIIDVEEISPPVVPATGSTPSVTSTRVPGPSRPVDPLKGADWPTAFRDVTFQMRTLMRTASAVMNHHRLKANLPTAPVGLITEWEGWASDMVEWAATLTETPDL